MTNHIYVLITCGVRILMVIDKMLDAELLSIFFVMTACPFNNSVTVLCSFCEQEVHDYLKSLCPDLHITHGEYDEDSRYPETKTLTIGQFKLGICHGHQVIPWGDLDSLAMLQRQLDVDILITGHTHQFKAYKHEGGIVIIPGSATGAYSSFTYDVNPRWTLTGCAVWFMYTN
ncbi:hypothetical protein MANES_01G188500v8 [Manihot esculenta]|uniref:Uncharacterized protein n=3 Tax=Manihot esculenta TaxID=3983 RepID=A0ACB7IEC5_MANES|nr:hypothetical protein MANES_01G188500v8 [Manihot esculenta]KAG8663216.1 hypothetical protein MANES_01G188500v8 [Manihot esculenta]KAG8663217.1 hypothetical protein MANES_01G188500v8 [Manihot esculenta]